METQVSAESRHKKPSSQKYRQVVEQLLEGTGVGLNGNGPLDIQVKDERFFARLFRDASLGSGESYMDGWWDCDSLDDTLTRVLSAGLDTKIKANWRIMAFILKTKIFNMQTQARSFEVGQRHYDIGNDLYQRMLDPRLVYTCAYWKETTDLAQAQEAKLDLVCRKVGLKPGMKVLDLGCGWASFAKFAAENYGAQVVGYTVSKAQVELGRELCQGLPVEIRLEDYRNATGLYDAVVSIGIMEHVGYRNYETYMKVASSCLKPEGIAFIHTIATNLSMTHADPWLEKYIFPNGVTPSIAQMGSAMEKYFVLEDLHNIGPDYDKTLLAWYRNFHQAWPELKDKYGERFYRMWKYYLLSCAAIFRSRNAQVYQMVLTHNGRPQPDCRLV